MRYQYNDGGRRASGCKGDAGDCVCRAVSIASGRPYDEVYRRLAEETGAQRAGKRGKPKGRTARDGILTKRLWFKSYMQELGFTLVPCMTIGSGCKVHVKDGELPMGRLVLSLSRHCAAVIDGVLHDTYDCSRGETRCVYGFFVE